MLTRKKSPLCIIAVIAVLSVIIGNSLLPSTASSDISTVVLNFARNVVHNLGFDAQWITSYSIRKLSHFAEFAILGGALSFVFRRNISLVLMLGMTSALLDETVQTFVQGRHGSLFDVWLDFSGVCLGVIFVYDVLAVVKTIKETK